MSIRVMSEVWEADGINSTECLVLIALADHANDDGRCYPSVGRLANRTKLSDRGVQKVISRLIEKGFVTVEPCAGKRGANVYVITATPEPRSPLNDVHPRTTFTTPPNHVRETPEPRSPEPSITIIEPSVSKTKAQKPADILSQVASPEAAKSFVSFRAKIKKPLTETAANRLAKSLIKIVDGGGDADDALGMAEERGWQAIKPEWYFKEISNEQHPSQNHRAAADSDSTARQIAFAARAIRTPREDCF